MPRSDEAQAFFHAVYSAVQEIPPGKVTSYGHIARLVGERELPPPLIVLAVQLTTSPGICSPAPPPSRRVSEAPPESGGLEPRARGRGGRRGGAAAAVPSWECAVAEGGECQGGDFAEVSTYVGLVPSLYHLTLLPLLDRMAVVARSKRTARRAQRDIYPSTGSHRRKEEMNTD